MSLMDDVFDVRDALKNKPEAESFDRIETAMWEFEEQNIKLNQLLGGLMNGITAIKELMK